MGRGELAAVDLHGKRPCVQDMDAVVLAAHNTERFQGGGQ